MSSAFHQSSEKETVEELSPSPGLLENQGQVTQDAESSAQASGRKIRGLRWLLVVCAIYSSMFIFSLDTTITADLVPSISNDFNSVTRLPWLSVGFTVGTFVGILPMGQLYAKYDLKHVYIASVAIFLASSALCGASPNMTAMIFGRVFLGVAGSAMYCGIMTFIALFAEEKERPLYFAICGLVWSVGTVLGPVIGGAFAKVNWRWAFYLNLIIGGVFMPIYLFVFPSFDPVPKTVTWTQRARTFDYLGALLLAGFPVCLVMAINFGGVLYAWDSGSIIALFAVGGVLAIVFGAQQTFLWLVTPAERLFPCSLLRYKEPLLLFIISIGSNAASFIAIFYIPVYFQFTRGDSPLEAAVRLLPQITVFSAANMAQGALLVKVGYYWPWFCAGGILTLTGNTMLYFMGAYTAKGYIYGSEVVLALGLGFCNQTPFGVIHSVVPSSMMGLAIPFILIAQFTGVTIGLSVAGAIFINQGMAGLRHLLPGYPEALLSQIMSGTSSSAIESIPEELRGAVIDIIVNNLRMTFIPAIFGSGVVLIASVFLSKKNRVNGG